MGGGFEEADGISILDRDTRAADIEAAQANGLRAISVMTGISPVEELEALRPDVLLRDLRELRLRMVM